jgi:hypothetical protein
VNEHVTEADLVRAARINRQRRGETTSILHRGSDGISRLRDPQTGKVRASFVSAPPEPEQDYVGFPTWVGWCFVVFSFLTAAAIATAVGLIAWHLLIASTRIAI